MISAGIDGGSRAIKVVLLDCADCEVVACGVRAPGVDHDRLAGEVFEELLREGQQA